MSELHKKRCNRYYLITPKCYDMAPNNPRRTVGNKIHVLAKHVAHEKECRILFGSNWASKLVEGVVVSAKDGRSSTSSRSNWQIKVRCTFPKSNKLKTVNLCSVRNGPIPDTSSSVIST